MAEWKRVTKEDFEDYIEAVEMEHRHIHAEVVQSGFTVYFIGMGDYRKEDWIAKRVKDTEGTHYFITER